MDTDGLADGDGERLTLTEGEILGLKEILTDGLTEGERLILILGETEGLSETLTL